MTEKELIRQADEKLERRLAEAAKIGNLVVTDAVRDEKVIKETFQKGGGIFRLFPAFVPRRFGKAGHQMCIRDRPMAVANRWRINWIMYSRLLI